MKVLILLTSSNKRTEFGIKTYNEQEVGLARALTKRGIQCGIVYYGGRLEKTDEMDVGTGKVKMYLLKGRDFLKTTVFDKYDYLCEEYDILMPVTYDHYESYHLAMKYPEKTIVYQGTYYSPFNKRYNFKCAVVDKIVLSGYRKKNTAFVMKNKLAEGFLNKKGLNNTKVIGVGFDAEQMQINRLLESDLSRKICAIKEEYKVILYVGRIEPRRNTLFLLQAFSKIAEKEKVKLVVIGKGSGKYKERCRNLITKLELEDSIIYQEYIEQEYLPQIYGLSDLFLLPTSYEIFGMVILEAMYFGTPVLTTENGGSDILIENGKTGYIIPELDVEKWVQKSVDILNSDTTQLTETAHQRIVEEFTWDSLVDKFIYAFNSKIDGGNGALII